MGSILNPLLKRRSSTIKSRRNPTQSRPSSQSSCDAAPLGSWLRFRGFDAGRVRGLYTSAGAMGTLALLPIQSRILDVPQRLAARCTATGLTAATDTLRTSDEVRRTSSFCTSQDRYSLPREVPIGIATLHEFTRDSAHKAEDDLQASE
jgi:hypothetical protein